MEVQKIHIFKNFCNAVGLVAGKEEYTAGMKGILPVFQLVYSTAFKKDRKLTFSMVMRLVLTCLWGQKGMIGFDHNIAAVISQE